MHVGDPQAVDRKPRTPNRKPPKSKKLKPSKPYTHKPRNPEVPELNPTPYSPDGLPAVHRRYEGTLGGRLLKQGLRLFKARLGYFNTGALINRIGL